VREARIYKGDGPRALLQGSARRAARLQQRRASLWSKPNTWANRCTARAWNKEAPHPPCVPFHQAPTLNAQTTSPRPAVSNPGNAPPGCVGGLGGLGGGEGPAPAGGPVLAPPRVLQCPMWVRVIPEPGRPGFWQLEWLWPLGRSQAQVGLQLNSDTSVGAMMGARTRSRPVRNRPAMSLTRGTVLLYGFSLHRDSVPKLVSWCPRRPTRPRLSPHKSLRLSHI